MKFRRLLEYNIVPEWSAYYVEYRLLKKIFSAYRNYLSSPVSEIQESFLSNCDIFKELCREIEFQSEKVNKFYIEKFTNLKKDLNSMIECIYDLKRTSTLNEQEAESLLSMKERDDTQSRATSMQRAFTELYQHIMWLEGFCELNYIALLKILIKFDSSALKFNIEALSFRRSQEELSEMKELIYKIIADECMNGDKESAIKLLKESKHFKSIDIGIISFCLGFLIIILSISSYLLLINDIKLLSPSTCIFRLTLCISVSIILFAWLIFMLEKYSVNWMYIFEVTPTNKISYVEILRFGIIMITIWLSLYSLHLSTTFYYPITGGNFIPILTLFIYGFLILCPFNIICRTARFKILKLFGQVIIAPFGEIKFTNYLFASWITSMVIPLKDLYVTILFLFSYPNGLEFSPSEEILLLLSALPFIWRILQNIKRVVYKKSLIWRQLKNMIRYVISLGLVTSAYFDYYKHYAWVFSFICGTIVISLLDIKQDWQISFDNINEERCLPVKFYYYASLSNILLRYAGVATLLPVKVLQNKYFDLEICVTLLALMELFRRTQWDIIRIEREKNDNKEKFRKVKFIPGLISK